MQFSVFENVVVLGTVEVIYKVILAWKQVNLVVLALK